ncbi:TetR/AcrR family transcriptional regulator [Thalassospira sp. TSL5-1]|uniref:TetR/AcrR family transcriptional regulator n=1 Tax=Thalassospira sp. TSL5-1 TaxID=1544451 RepID=UPI000A5880D0|nr:TetR/AcrR family transcriptional regulator [Thalassospira sp. TSL5-1]
MSTRVQKPDTPMLKQPRQARSRATVETIVIAAARILADQGWAGFTTNRVAEVAGVSIGSLYQYFPDKLSLIDAIRERHLADCLSVLRNVTATAKPLPVFVEELVSNIIAIHSINPGLHRVLLDEAPFSDTFRNPDSAFEQEYLGYYERAVCSYQSSKDTVSAQLGARIISDAIDGVIHNAARRGTLNQPEIKHQLVKMIIAYIKQ